MIIPNITPLPPSPQRTDPATFAARADASLTAQETVFTPELNAFASAVNVTQGEMTVLSATATEQAQIATTQATAAASSALSAGATVWVSGTTYTAGVSKYSPLDGQVYRRMIIGAGTTDPSLDAVNWRVVNGLTSELIVLPFNNLPQIRPSLSLDFANNQSVDPRITFTRASTATRTNSRGLIESVASGVPRIDFDPVTGACKGLLIEEQRANLLTYSEAFDNGVWGKTRASITPNATIAPDGTLTADKYVEDSSASNSHTMSQPYTDSVGTTLTVSCFLKAGERAHVWLQISDNATGAAGCVFNLSAGTFATPSNGGPFSATSAAITSVGNGWYRCSLTTTRTGSGTAWPYIAMHNGTSGTYTGDGTSGLFIWGAQLEAGAFPTTYQPSTETFTGRASTATFYGSNGLIQTASSGVARMNYNPMNLTVAPKLLLEAAGTNLLTYSEAFDNGVWGKTRATVTVNATIAPDGLLTAEKLVDDSTASNNHYIEQNATATTANPHTLSVFVKPDSRTYVNLRILEGTPFARSTNVNFDLSAATVGTKTDSGGASASSASIVSVGGGWFRCSLTTTLGGSATSILAGVFLSSAGGTAYTGDGTSGLFIWGAQLEAGAFPTSYIPTVASQVTRVADTSTSAQTTRAADVAKMEGANFSSWYRQDEGSFVAIASAAFDSSASLFPTHLSVNDGTLSNRIVVGQRTIDDTIIGTIVNAGVTQTDFSAISSATYSTPNNIALVYKTNDAAIARSGVLSQTDATLTVPAVNQMTIGTNAGTSVLNGHIRSLSYYPKRLTNLELQALSTQ